MQPASLQQVIDILQKKGYTEDQIADTTADLTKAAFTTLYSNAMAAFTEEDVQMIENCETDEEANKKIMELYKLRTGKDPQEEMNKFLEKFAKDFTAEQQTTP